MDEKIKAAFDSVKAEQELKTATKYFLYENYIHTTPKRAFSGKKALCAAAACLVLIVCTSIFTYSTPVSAISLDGERSSVELGINCFNKVVTVTCFGNEEAISCLNLKNKDYREAVSAVLEGAEEYGNSPTLTVSCKNEKKCNKMTSEIQACHSADAHIQHHGENHSISEEAHSHGLSTGKYSAYLTLKQYEPELTAEEAAALTMRELRDRIALYEEEAEAHTEATTEASSFPEHHSEGQGNHHGNTHQ